MPLSLSLTGIDMSTGYILPVRESSEVAVNNWLALTGTREVISPSPFESFGRQLQQLSRARGLRDNSTLH